VLNPRNLAPLVLTAALASLGCHAQTPAVVSGQPLPLATARRVEVLLRQKANLPPDSTINVGVPTASELPGYESITVTFSNEGQTSHPIHFLISADGKTMAQFNKFDISADPRSLVSAEGRPSRGGPLTAPVLIVGFDDLECPYCARLHESIFPAITQRYGDKVHIVYKDFPLEQHPWAMHAAVDVNCLATQSPKAYWDMVDYVHGHSSDIGADPRDPKADKTLPRAAEQLDTIAREQATSQHLDATALDACLKKQDTATIEESKKLGVKLGVDSTPALFINGDKIDGAVPIGFIFGVIDDALRAQNVAPPPPYVDPAPPAPAATPGASTPAKPGN
jgi:protein-disulfide isomerase